ncbi:hypothetical protein L873DRAFT_1796438 [Choiromyces venosus 120613-1]|uniref:Uncharacterized protein n=1 Tax=Choiromyces venosus 120613-1 TaxID=1336337 RepID=A0A3N4IX30_9PEZI|nr:hypothetical protein L873DRAFT_1796438 [Choiromyces venosus 120613-1]
MAPNNFPPLIPIPYYFSQTISHKQSLNHYLRHHTFRTFLTHTYILVTFHFSEVYIQQDSPRTFPTPTSIEPLRVDEDAHPVASDFTPSSSAFTKLSALITAENKLRYSTVADLAIGIEEKIEECLESETGCYMLVTGVAEHMVEEIDEALQGLGIHKMARFTYEQTMESLIVRLMPGAPHEHVLWSFSNRITLKVTNIPGHSVSSLDPVGATRFSVLCQRSKKRAMQASNRVLKRPNSLRLECLKMMNDTNRRATRNTTPWIPGCSQYFDIDHAGTVAPAGRGLVTPYRTLFDTSQLGDPDIIVSAGELSEWALRIYRDFE